MRRRYDLLDDQGLVAADLVGGFGDRAGPTGRLLSRWPVSLVGELLKGAGCVLDLVVYVCHDFALR